ncbi:MAG: T9SS type A sorting domain-containing protein, partial [Bacteroidia bacterium]
IMCTAVTCSALCAGNYTYYVTDATGCKGTGFISITQPPVLSVAVGSSSATCGTCSNGAVSSTVTGGSPAYTYSWSNGATTPTVGGLLPGCYTLTAKDAQNCTQTQTVCVGFVSGISMLNAISGNIYVVPNPSNGQFTITTDINDVYDVSIYNSIGQLIKHIPQNRSNVNVDLSMYGKGMYNVLFNVNGNYKNVKVIVE